MNKGINLASLHRETVIIMLDTEWSIDSYIYWKCKIKNRVALFISDQ